MQPKRIAEPLEIPTLEGYNGISPHRDLLYVQQTLGHKSIQNTMIYIQYEKALFGTSVNEEFTVKVATNIKEACALAEVGFEYVTGEYSNEGKNIS